MSASGSERERFIHVMSQEGVSLGTARTLLRHAATLQRIAELECSSEAADRDRVPCPALKGYECACDFGYTVEGQHETVPRVTAQSKRLEHRIREILKGSTLTPSFQGDPRGYVFKLHVPSGRDESYGGVGVPA